MCTSQFVYRGLETFSRAHLFYSDAYLNYSVRILVSHPCGSLKNLFLLNNANNYDANLSHKVFLKICLLRPVTPSCVPIVCSRRCKALESQEKLRKIVQFQLKFLQVRVSRRPDGIPDASTEEVPRRVTAFVLSTWRLTAFLLSIRRALMTY